VFGVRPEDVVVLVGDTDLIPIGGGTFGSRSAVTAGSAVHIAAVKTREKLLLLASDLLEVDTEDLVVADGMVFPVGLPGGGVSLGDLAELSLLRSGSKTSEHPGLLSTEYFVPSAVTFGYGTHVATVQVDIETGMVKVLSYLVVDDCGTILNPMVVDGQQHGGVAHGLGNILLEEAGYTAEGQPTNVTFMDYLLPTADDVPNITVIHRPHPSPLNPLGAKGAGEGATSSAPAAIANAVCDALRPLEIEIVEMPIRPERLLQLIIEARSRLQDNGKDH
jgi:carbon-monoxide dehydrogenase large subunit